jgi:hypothetical protein
MDSYTGQGRERCHAQAVARQEQGYMESSILTRGCWGGRQSMDNTIQYYRGVYIRVYSRVIDGQCQYRIPIQMLDTG